MRSIATKTGGIVTADDGNSPQISHSDDDSGKNGRETRTRLQRLAREVFSEISEIDDSRKEDLLGAFVLELGFLAREQEYRENRRQKHAEKIAAAKARGVRFGAQRRALPENFEELRQAWRNGKISLKVAAEACGIPKSTFHDAVLRAETASGEEQRPPEKRPKKRAKETVEAKPKSTRRGPKPKALPEDFDELRQAWRNKELTLKAAADICGLPQSTFYNAAVRAELAARFAETG